jgi:hypothetical protein
MEGVLHALATLAHGTRRGIEQLGGGESPVYAAPEKMQDHEHESPVNENID